MKKQTILSHGQQEILKLLIPYAALATNTCADQLPMNPRSATLLAGPTGVGKSRIIEELAERMKLPLWKSNVSGWQVQGARGDAPTLHNLFEWVDSQRRGIIFLDELDKLSGGTDWYSSVRLEIHDAIDGRLPPTFKSPFSASDEEHLDYPQECKIVIKEEDRVMSSNERSEKHSKWKAGLELKLKTRFFIVGAGAWQYAWDPSPSAVGFVQEKEAPRRAIDRKNLLQSIAPEILNRFRSDIAYLDPMTEDDYWAFATLLGEKLPEDLQGWFAMLCEKKIQKAVSQQLGMRIFEEMIANAWVDRFMHNVATTKEQTGGVHNFI